MQLKHTYANIDAPIMVDDGFIISDARAVLDADSAIYIVIREFLAGIHLSDDGITEVFNDAFALYMDKIIYTFSSRSVDR